MVVVIFGLSLSQVLFAQADSQWEWAVSVPAMGGTSEMRGVATDGEGNTIVVGQIQDPFSGQERGGAIAKYDAAGVQIWNYNIPEAFYNGSTFMDAVCDDDQNVYAVLVYSFKSLVVEGDSVEESDMALLKLDKVGALQFIKPIGSTSSVEKLFGLSIQGDEIFVKAFGGGTFDREGIFYSFPNWGRAYVMSFNLDGDLITSAICAEGLYDQLDWVKKEENSYYSYLTNTTVKKTMLDTATQVPVNVATLDLVNQVGGYALKVTDLVITEAGRIYVSGFFESAYIILEGDTLFNANNGYPTCFLIEMDDSLKAQNHILYYDVSGNPCQNDIQKLAVFKNEKLAVQNWFATSIQFPEDSMVALNNQQCASIVELNLDLSVKSMNQVNVWLQPRWVSWDLDYDGLGNLFCLFQHEEDMYFDTILVKSANKSWAHLSALGKLKTGATVSIAELDSKIELKLYPIPTHDRIFISTQEKIAFVRCYDVTGKAVKALQMNESNEIDVSRLSKGIYVLNLTYEDGSIRSGRFVKE